MSWLDEATEDTDESIRDLAHRRVGFHRLHDCRHHIAAGDGVVSKRAQASADLLVIAPGAVPLQIIDLLIGADFVIRVQLDSGLLFIAFDVAVDADFPQRARFDVLLPLIGIFRNFGLDQPIADRLYDPPTESTQFIASTILSSIRLVRVST